MRNGFARCLVLAGLAAPALFACSDDKPEETGTTAGTSSGGSAAGTQSGGSATAGTNASAGTASGNGGTTGTAGTGTAGTGTAGTGTAGTSTAGTASGGSGGGTGGSGGSASGGGGAGGGSGMPTAVAEIKGLMGKVDAVKGTATFTQGATMTTLVLNLTACPDGPHSSHLHENKDCGPDTGDGNAAGGHWVNGQGLGDYTCAGGKGMLTVTRGTDKWTVGGAAATDVTKYAFMVHEMGDANAGGRIGCGVINKQ